MSSQPLLSNTRIHVGERQRLAPLNARLQNLGTPKRFSTPNQEKGRPFALLGKKRRRRLRSSNGSAKLTSTAKRLSKVKAVNVAAWRGLTNEAGIPLIKR